MAKQSVYVSDRLYTQWRLLYPDTPLPTAVQKVLQHEVQAALIGLSDDELLKVAKSLLAADLK